MTIFLFWYETILWQYSVTNFIYYSFNWISSHTLDPNSFLNDFVSSIYLGEHPYKKGTLEGTPVNPSKQETFLYVKIGGVK